MDEKEYTANFSPANSPLEKNHQILVENSTEPPPTRTGLGGCQVGGWGVVRVGVGEFGDGSFRVDMLITAMLTYYMFSLALLLYAN